MRERCRRLVNLMAPAAVPPRKCSLRSFIDNRLVLLLYDALEKWQNDGATEGASLFTHSISGEERGCR